MATTCKICGNSSGNAEHVAREMMFGTREPFSYLECGACRSLHLIDVPDLGPHYPGSYYSYDTPQAPRSLKARLKHARARHRYHPSLLGALLVKLFGPDAAIPWLAPLDLRLDDPVLDVGCGAGATLHELSGLGFTDLTGIDPYAPDDAPPYVRRADVFTAEPRKYKLVMFHHSLEHMEDPVAVLKRSAEFVRDDGRLLVRIPLAGGFAWRKYGVNWVQLDAPRHLYLFSESAFGKTAEHAGFTVETVVYDSNELQFWGSELYVKGVPLIDPVSRSANQRLFAEAELESFRAAARTLNADRDGDQACFVLKPA